MDTCIICKTNQTRNHVKIDETLDLHVCHECMDQSKQQFILVCASCHSSFKRDPQHMIDNMEHPDIKYGLEVMKSMMKDEGVIMGIDSCPHCPDFIDDDFNKVTDDEGGHA